MIADLAELRAAVDARFHAARPQLWDDPHPDMSQPADEEYSRLPDPDKYRTLQLRCRIWIDVLVESGLATAAEPVTRTIEHYGTVETLIARSTRPGTEPLIVHLTGDNLPGVVLALGDPLAVLTEVPFCGCDACDDGSDRLLEEIDDVIGAVLDGVAVVECTPTSHSVVLGSGSHRSIGERDGVVGRWSGAAWLDAAG